MVDIEARARARAQAQAQARTHAAKMDELLARHRKEIKDLQNSITGMKKQATKSTRKEVNSKCAASQDALRIKQEGEVRELMQDRSTATHESDEFVTPEQLLQELDIQDVQEEAEPVQTAGAPTKKRRNRQKEKLARREAEIERIKEEARKEASKQPDLKTLEQEAIGQLCELKGLEPFDIKPDGHCLYASILDQLKIRHDQTDLDVYRLRSIACEYMRNNREDFVPYMFDEESLQLKDIDEYTKEMETTAKWGGELEILALAKSFECPISVLMSGRPIHIVNENSAKPELKLVYYKHSYALGEHYNSLHDIQRA